MPNTPPLNIAVWSPGAHARKNTIPAIISCPDTRLVGVLARDQVKSASVADEFNCQYWSSAQAMLEDEQVDGVYIASPVGLHFEQGMEVIRHKKHLLCEKSLTGSYAETKRLAEAAQNAGVLLAECFMYLYHAQFRQLQVLLAEAPIGHIHQIDACFGYPQLDPGNIRYDKSLGGGALLDAGAYPLSALLAIMGQAPVDSHGFTFTDEGFEVDTRGALLCRFGDGVTGRASWGMGLDYRSYIEIWGSAGSIRVNRAFAKPAALDTSIVISRNGVEETLHTGQDNHFIKMFSHFAALADKPQSISGQLTFSLQVAELVQMVSANNN